MDTGLALHAVSPPVRFAFRQPDIARWADIGAKAAAGAGTVSYTHLDVYKRQGFTSNDPESIRIPAVLPSERAALQFALGTLMGLRQGDPRIVWSRDTNSLNTLWVSEPWLEEARAHPQLTALGPALQLPFDPQGNRLLGMWEEPR